MVRASTLPIFTEYNISQLHELLGYSELYLATLKTSSKRLSPRFQTNASKILRRPIPELFEAPDA